MHMSCDIEVGFFRCSPSFSIWILASSYSIVRKAPIASSIFSPFDGYVRRNISDIIISMPHFGLLIQQAFHWTGWLGWQKKKAAAMGMVGMVEILRSVCRRYE